MTNLLLCSAVLKEGSQKSLAPTGHARQLCRHLVETIGILQPTLVISQGWGLVPTLRELRRCTPDQPQHRPLVLADCDLDGNRFVWVALWHPTRFWSTINQRYFRETVVPAITAARKRALKLAQTV